jgi:hypothetical protein
MKPSMTLAAGQRTRSRIPTVAHWAAAGEADLEALQRRGAPVEDVLDALLAGVPDSEDDDVELAR